MSEPWHDINDPGSWAKPEAAPADNTRVAMTDNDAKPKEKAASIATLSDAKFCPPQSGIKFNDKCSVQVSVTYKEETPRTRVTFKLFCNHKGKKKDLQNKVDSNESNGIAKAQLTFFYPDDYSDGIVEYFFTAEHCRGDKVVESDRLTLPTKQEHLFPLKTRPVESYKEEPRSFGSERDSGTRKHAGCDLYAPIGTDVIAVEDGTVLRGPYEFAGGTYALEIDHGFYLVRYTEIGADAPAEVKPGNKVKRGQVIGKVGKFVGQDGTVRHMLHFEMYSNKDKGPLTDTNNPPFMRRKDLENPTDFLDEGILMGK